VIANIYRAPKRDRFGDAVDDDGNPAELEFIGTATGVIIGSQSWQPRNTRGDVVDTTGLVGVPVAEPVQPRLGDLLVVDGVRHAVKGPAQWTHANTLTGTAPRYTW
jgi:hypothetical protein